MSSVAVTFLAALSIGSASAFQSADSYLRNGLTSRGCAGNRCVQMPGRRRDNGIAFSESNHNVNGDSESNAEGDALAKEFYELMRTRSAADVDEEEEKEEYRRLYQQQLDQMKKEDQPPSQLLPEDEARSRNRDPFVNRREVRVGKYDIPAPLSGGPSKSRKKFTGATPRLDSTGTPSAGLFSGDGGRVYSYPAGSGSSTLSNDSRRLPNDARSRIVRQEFNLVGRATGDRAFFAQAAILVLMAALYAYVGLSGGITDGSERFLEPSEFNPVGEAINSAMDGMTAEDWSGVVPKIEGSVWL